MSLKLAPKHRYRKKPKKKLKKLDKNVRIIIEGGEERQKKREQKKRKQKPATNNITPNGSSLLIRQDDPVSHSRRPRLGTENRRDVTLRV